MFPACARYSRVSPFRNCHLNNPLAFKLAFHEEQIYKCLFGNINYDSTISKIELSSVFFWGTFADFLSRWFIAFHWGPRKISCWSLQNIGNNFLLCVAHFLIGVKWFHSTMSRTFHYELFRHSLLEANRASRGSQRMICFVTFYSYNSSHVFNNLSQGVFFQLVFCVPHFVVRADFSFRVSNIEDCQALTLGICFDTSQIYEQCIFLGSRIIVLFHGFRKQLFRWLSPPG